MDFAFCSSVNGRFSACGVVGADVHCKGSNILSCVMASRNVDMPLQKAICYVRY
jgi:hypothetical protein